MIVYEVNVTVDASIKDAYLNWLDGHIKEIVGIDGVLSASLYERDATPETAGGWTMHYRMKDRKAYDSYIANYAPLLREDASKRFGEKFQATRRVLSALQDYS